MHVTVSARHDGLSVEPDGWGAHSQNMTPHIGAAITVDTTSLIDTAYRQAQTGLAEGGIPIGAALFSADGTLLGQGRNRRVQHDDPSVHGETDAFRAAGRQRDYSSTIMVTTLAPCWYCSGLIRQFGIGAVVIGENRTFAGGEEWLRDLGVDVTILDDERCVGMMTDFIADHPALWNEDIGVVDAGVREARSEKRGTVL